MKLIEKEEAAKLLQQEGVIIYPTETFYGLGCRIGSIKALERIYEIKERPKHMPLPLIVGNTEQALDITEISEHLREDTFTLMNLWPESLSLCLPAKRNINSIITGGTGRVVLRQSPHPVADFLAKAVNEGIISTSANKSGEKPAANYEDLNKNLLADGVVKGENMAGKLPSTIVQPMGNKVLKLLRKGTFEEGNLISLGFSIVF